MNLGLSKPLLDALAAKDYTQATPIQAKAIPTVLTGRDLLGIAQTGTGKTAAFMLPSLQRLAANRPQFLKPGHIRMLVLAPTRELASQIADSAKAYGRFMQLSVGVIFGGVPNGKSVRTVQRGLDVLVATPGRLLDLGFIHALKRIVALVPQKRQTLFFSATMPKAIKQLADQYLTNPAEVSVTPVASTVDRIEQRLTFVNQAEKTALLIDRLGSEPVERALVFSRTKHGADKVVRMLEAAGIPANAIHGNKSQPARERALASFKRGATRVVVATDIAARGIDVKDLPHVVNFDIPGVSHVFNFDLPDVPEQYVHRIGRTARAGADGIAIAFCSPEERGNLRDIERLTKQKLAAEPLPEDFASLVSAIKALKPAPKQSRPQRPQHPQHKADRRAEGQRRDNRNQRRPQRAAGNAGHRNEGVKSPGGNRRRRFRNRAGSQG
jgi:ATP-dependent RNA helicase RhlE